MKRHSSSPLLGPARLTALGFLLLILLGSALLMLPFSSVQDGPTSFLSALFTATSAVSLTGLIVVDTGSYWTLPGQIIIITLIQLGGLGIMSLASLSGMLLTGRISMRARASVAAESRLVTTGGIRRTLAFTFLFTLVAESLIAAIITARLILGYGYSPGRAIWEGVFHSISAFNNAGFSTHSDNLMSFAHDAYVLLPIAAALIGGGLGYPVWFEVASKIKHRQSLKKLSITTRMTLRTTFFLLVLGSVLFAAMEWTGALSGMSLGSKLLNAFFQGATPRTAGFNSIDYAEAHPITLMMTDALMFIGGGSAGTAGGIKVTTASILIAAMAAEFLGRRDTTVGNRRIPETVIRQSLALAFAGVCVVTAGVAALRIFEPQFTADQITFEVFSAFATVGLSTGITASLTAPSQVVLCCIMYLGRVGPTTLIAALVARSVSRHYSYPEERPFIG